jgi:hypothetical protein
MKSQGAAQACRCGSFSRHRVLARCKAHRFADQLLLSSHCRKRIPECFNDIAGCALKAARNRVEFLIREQTDFAFLHIDLRIHVCLQ